MTPSQVLEKMVARINRHVRVSYVAEGHRAPDVLPADRWWQLNAASRMQSGIWGTLLLAPGGYSTLEEKRGNYPSRLR